jgi:hypothetical protein
LLFAVDVVEEYDSLPKLGLLVAGVQLDRAVDELCGLGQLVEEEVALGQLVKGHEIFVALLVMVNLLQTHAVPIQLLVLC